MITSYLIIVIILFLVVYVAYKSTGHDTEIILGQKREVKLIGDRIQEVLDIEKTERKIEREHRSIISEANKLVKQNRFKQAEKKYLNIIKNDHKNLKAYIGLGNIYVEQEEYRGAMAAFKRVTELDPTNELAFNNLGMAYMKERRYEEAASAYEHAVALNSKVSHRYVNLALAYEKSGNFKKQITSLEKAIQLDETNVDLLNVLADTATNNNETSVAEKALKKLVEINPADLDAQRKLARIKPDGSQ